MFYQNESKLRTFFINEYGGRFKHSSSSINDSGFVEIYYQKDMIMVDKLVCKLNCATGLGNMTDLYNMDTIVKEKKMTLITIPESYLYLEEYQYGYVNFLPTNFQSIELKNLLFGGSYIVKNDIDTLAFAMDLNWIRIVDSTFFGEKSSYKAVSKIGGRYFSTYSKSIPRWETIPGYKLENIANDLYKITFTKTTFWNRIDTIFFNLYFENELVITHKLATKIDNSLVFSVNKIDLTKTTFSYYCKSNLCTYPQARIAVENKKIY
jgi:hypothetical protein